jgi:hypothetical protein
MTAKPAKSNALSTQPENLQGYAIDSSDPAALGRALELAFDYRGDVTITRKSGGLPIEGYIFDRRTDRTTAEVLLRMIPRDTDDRLTIPVSDIAMLKFTGKDTASGRTFENWIKKYAQKKLAGETACIESEPLDSE